VGGFSASDWLFSRLQGYLLPRGIQFCRPDSHANKAVADGAIAYYLDHVVSARVARWTYGTGCMQRYNPSDPQHAARSGTVLTDANGEKCVPNGFCAILVKGTQVSQDKEFTSSYIRDRRDISTFESVKETIKCYRGISQNPQWIDTEPNMFPTLCTMTADTSQVAKLLKPRYGLNQVPYYRLHYKIILLFGLTELKAQISSMENGIEKRCPAKLVYD